MELYNKNYDLLILKNKDYLLKKIKVLTKSITNKTSNNKAICSEIFSSLFIEEEYLSRKKINSSINNYQQQDTKINNFINSYKFIGSKPFFTIASFFTLYSLLSNKVIDDGDCLSDGEMWRSHHVYIGKFNQGFNAKDVKKALKNLCNYLNDSSENIYLRAIIGHIYFELIHPYYDFNGRTGRFIPFWLFNNNQTVNKNNYFSTAMNNYREQYLAIFNKNIDRKTLNINLDRMVDSILDLLILNQKQYHWIKDLETKYTNKTKKVFSEIQKKLIWSLIIKSEIANSSDSWFKLSSIDKIYIEKTLKASNFSNHIKRLIEAKIIDTTNTSPKRYKILNYKVFNINIV